MTGCAALGCRNRSEQGYLMRAFPKNPERRAIWAAKVKRQGWIPTKGSFLCQVHFEEDQWEKVREDGSRKLKLSAVPTKFSISAKKNEAKRKRYTPHVYVFNKNDHTYSAGPSFGPPCSPVTVMDETAVGSVSCNEESAYDNVTLPLSEPSAELLTLNDNKCRCCGDKVRRKDSVLRKLRRKIKVQYNEICTLRNNKTTPSLLLRKFFINTTRNENKHAHFRNENKRWTNKMIQKAIILRLACGRLGYLELLKQNYPLPPLRILHNHVQGLKKLLFER